MINNSIHSSPDISTRFELYATVVGLKDYTTHKSQRHVFSFSFFFPDLRHMNWLSTCKMATHHRQNAAGRRKVQV